MKAKERGLTKGNCGGDCAMNGADVEYCCMGRNDGDETGTTAVMTMWRKDDNADWVFARA